MDLNKLEALLRFALPLSLHTDLLLVVRVNVDARAEGAHDGAHLLLRAIPALLRGELELLLAGAARFDRELAKGVGAS